MNLQVFLSAVQQIGGALLQNSPAIIDLVNVAMTTLRPKDQAEAKSILAAIQADNDAGFARLDAKLEAASRR